MRREPTLLHDTTFDLVVVGGGITGACLAHDATLRGLSVAVVERGDFGSETSAASSKLLHGGIRYLQQGRVDKLRESARERASFQRIAPHLTRWVPFLIPTQRSVLRGRALLQSGMWMYQWLTRGGDRGVRDPSKRTPDGSFCSHADLVRLVPELEARDDVTGAHVLYESHLHSSERMTLAFLKTAARGGAVVTNYTAVDRLLESDGRVGGVSVVDGPSGTRFDIKARMVANATGPWLTGLNDRLGIGQLKSPIRGFSKGAHIVTRQVVDTFALALPTQRRSASLLDRGGRHIFVIPWRGHSLIGTSDRSYAGPLDEVGPTDADIDDLLGDVTTALPGLELNRSDVCHAFAGLYPLTAHDVRPDVYQGTGDYQVIDHGRAGGMEGVVSVLGAKYTTARRVAERATTLICAKLGHASGPCQTDHTRLVGGAIDDLDRFEKDSVERHGTHLSRDTVANLVHHYGTETDAVVEKGSEGGVAVPLLIPLAPERETLGAEVRFAVEEEMAVTLADVVFRRTGLGTIGDPGEKCLRGCAEIMGQYLGWSEARQQEEVQATQLLFGVRGS